MRIETRQVPIERLIANLEREVKADPANVQSLINLARLHAMAFALKVDEFPAAQAKPDQPELPVVSAGVEPDSKQGQPSRLSRARGTGRSASQGCDSTL